MTYTEPQPQVRWTGRYTRTENGRLIWTSSSYETVLPTTPTEAFEVLARREGWLPHGPVTPDVPRGGWRLQYVYAEPVLAMVCSRCGQRGCGGRADSGRKDGRMRYRINIHNREGRTQDYGQHRLDADDYAEAIRKGWRLLPSHLVEAGWSVTADALPEPPADGICTRCGSQVSACGGPTASHE